MIARADAVRLPFTDMTFDLCIGSPPYADCRLYLEGGKEIGIARKTAQWIDWMILVTEEALRVSKGLVLWVVAGKTADWCYQPGPEGLLYQWWARGGHCFRPVYWHRVGIPGSGSGVWYRSDIEYVLAFKRPGKLPYANPTANGHAPKWAPGGDMSHRLTDGTRRNQWGGGEKSGATMKADGTRQPAGRPSHRVEKAARTITPGGDRMRNGEVQHYIPPTLADPGNLAEIPDVDRSAEALESFLASDPVVAKAWERFSAEQSDLIRCVTGGGLMGHSFAHGSEAPYPVKVPGFFIASHCPPKGLVLDPFSGSASTGQAALELGRQYVGCDLRQSQCLLSRRRIGTITPGFALTD